MPLARQVVVVLLLSLPASAMAGAGEDAAAEARRSFSAGEYAGAVALLDAAIARDARDASLHYWLARSQYELSHYDEAEKSARRAVALDPDNSEYHQWLGRALGRRAERAGWISGFSLARKVCAEFETAVRLDPRNIRAQRDLIEFYRQAPGIVGGGAEILMGGRDAEAERLLRQYLDTVPPRSDLPSKAAAREWLGQLYERQGRIEAAADEYRSALQLDRDRRAARDALHRLRKS